ncbi:60S ribosomal protein L32 [Cucumispora dikerogammari]|nr:60S ribosomal protein L32 [Cucumispora dikerogammari]
MSTPINPTLKNVIDVINKSKSHKVFKRHHCDKYKRVSASWRKPRGIDNRVRRKLKGAIQMPGKRFMKDPEIKYLNPQGFREVLVANVKDLEPLKNMNTNYAAVIRHSVGARKRIEIVEKADEFQIVVMNRNARIQERSDLEN